MGKYEHRRGRVGENGGGGGGKAGGDIFVFVLTETK